MAQIDKSILGFVSGKLGEVVFRKMNGKKFVSMGAKKYKISQSAKAKKGRANFAASVKFAVTINSLPELKNIWSFANLEGTNSYHRIIKYNSKLVNSGNLTLANKITPDGLELVLSSLSLTDKSKIELHFSFPSNKLKFPCSLFIVFFFNNDLILVQKAAIENAAVDDLYSIMVPLKNQIIKALKEFPNPLVYTAAAGVQVSKKKIYWTSTAAGEL